MCVVSLADLGCAPQEGPVPEVGVRQQGLTSPYSSVVLSDNPASYWRFNETSGPKVVDQQGARTGVYSAATLGQGGALANDADTALAVAASTGGNAGFGDTYGFAGNAPFSVEVWVRPASFNPTSPWPRRTA